MHVVVIVYSTLMHVMCTCTCTCMLQVELVFVLFICVCVLDVISGTLCLFLTAVTDYLRM